MESTGRRDRGDEREREEHHTSMAKSKRTQRPHGTGSPGNKRPSSGNNASGARPSSGTRPTNNAGRTSAANASKTPNASNASNASNSSTNSSTAARYAPSQKSPARSSLGTGAARRRRQQMPWWRQPRVLTVGGILLGAIAAVILFAILAHNAANANADNAKPASASLVNAVTNVSPQVSDKVGTGGLSNPFHALPASTAPLKGPSGKPQVLYLGAEYCPYCAADRWSLIVALSRFGSFSNLHTITSSSTDIYADTPTFTFYGSSYESQYVDFVPVEQTTRDQNVPLQTPTSEQEAIAAKYDAPPYISAPGIPFVDFGNLYITEGSGYQPSVLGGFTWDQIANALDNPNSPITKGIVGNANYMTAAICQMTNNQPASACSSPAIQQIMGQLPKGQ